MKWLKHAFAINSPEVTTPSETTRVLVDKLCVEIARRRLTAPALFLLEMNRPLNYISSQFLRFLQPFATMIADANTYQELVLFLEQRGSIDYICDRIEAAETTAAAAKSANALSPPGPTAPRTAGPSKSS